MFLAWKMISASDGVMVVNLLANIYMYAECVKMVVSDVAEKTHLFTCLRGLAVKGFGVRNQRPWFYSRQRLFLKPL